MKRRAVSEYFALGSFPLTAAAVCCLAFALLVSSAKAELKNPRSSYDYRDTSMAFDGGFIYRIQPTSESSFAVSRSSSPSGRGQIVARFKSDSNAYIYSTRLTVGGGQIAVEIYEYNDQTGSESSSVARAVADEIVPVSVLEDPPAAGVCSLNERLVDVLTDGRLIFESTHLEGLNGECGMQRARQTLTAVSPDGSTQVLRETRSAWGIHSVDPDEWTIALSGQLEFTRFTGGETIAANLLTGVQVTVPFALDKRFWELSQDGRMLTTQPVHKLPQTNLYTNAADLASKVVLQTPGQVSFFHFCGGQILEISRTGKRQSIKDGRRYWGLAVRDLAGVHTGSVKERLRRGTNFVGCDGQQAVFSEPRKGSNSRRKLTAVSLVTNLTQ
ncbi:MAG: hypothetical protein JHC87_07535 [Thermoleophilaceae bacterium]|nr:hypothetical protein [Thermoleophilaceae bacterium]